ncbi:hypothetical protein [Lysinibacillus xylanilyticus]|uniref:hypothetical protein n=1 Tax=Lysinibacillus xylanilyticus TaxID=582475 RepID=UPI003D967B39
MGISGRETKAKNITSILLLSLRFRAKKICRCRLAFAQKKVSPQATHRAESATPERKSTSRYGNEKRIYPQFFNFW